jgi:signal transduction histidine kinase
VLLVIIGGLVVAHLASFAFFELERSRSVERFEAAEVAARIADGIRSPAAFSAREAPPRFRPRLRWWTVEDLGGPPSGASVVPAVFAAELRRRLAESLGSDPVAWIASRELPRPEGAAHPEGMPGRPDRGSLRLVTVALDLGDRRVLAEAPIFQPSMGLPAEAWTSIALIFVVTALFSIFAVRLAVKPVRMLADAADRLSRNIAEPPLPERGAVEIRDAARAFNRMQDRLRRHVNGRALAFAAMSHDIRTPLTRMRLRLESLGEEAREKLEGDLGVIESIANSALELTRGLALDESPAMVDVAAMVRTLAGESSVAGGPVEVRGGAEPIEARPVALRRALANVIDNAVKYAREVSIELADTRDSVGIEVLDRGPGIPQEHLERVTDPFYRVEPSRNRGTGGAGLGLAIAKDVIEGHGGELDLGNRPEGGLRVFIRLPRQARNRLQSFTALPAPIG